MFGYEMSDYDKKVYENELADFLPQNIVDCHTHVYKKEFGINDDRKGCVQWTKMVAQDCEIEDLVQTYKDILPGKNVKPVIFANPTDRPLDKANGYVEQCAKKMNYPALFCTHSDMSAEYVEEQVKAGGFMGLKPYINNSPSYIPAEEIRIFDFLTKEHLEVANKNGWVVILHIGRSKRLRDPLNVAQLMEIEEKYPNVKLVVAHIGRAYSTIDIGDAFETLKHTKNMMFDFCANTLSEAMTECVKAVGTKRIMFGTDMPITKMRMYRITDEKGIYYNVVPRGLYGDVSTDIHMRETDEKNITNFMYEEIRAFKRTAETLGLSKADVEDIFCNNACKLFGIKF